MPQNQKTPMKNYALFDRLSNSYCNNIQMLQKSNTKNRKAYVSLCMCVRIHNSLLKQIHDLKNKQKLCKSLDARGYEALKNNA